MKSQPPNLMQVQLEGIAGSPGIAVGRAIIVDVRRPGVVQRHIPKHAAGEEMARFDAAVLVAAQGLREVAEHVRASTARAESSILEAYILMVEDESLRQDVERRVMIDQLCAEWALDCAVREMAEQLRGAGDPYLAERSHDFEFVEDRILRGFTGRQRTVSLPDFGEPAIVVAHDLSPAETAGLTKASVRAMVTEVGTRTSHTAILARALEIPAVVGVRDLLSHVGNGDVLFVDGIRGRVTVMPTDEMIASARRRAERYQQTRQAREIRGRPTTTRCGVPVTLQANIELPNEAATALSQGAQGIGLYRTEFLYVDRSEPPGEDEQYQTYKRVMELSAPFPVTLRTFDIGGDKFVSAFQTPDEMNPALGLRAVRLGLARPDLFKTQLRAMLRASVHGALNIMVPMVASLGELSAVSELLNQAKQELVSAGKAFAPEIRLGIMVEVPSAAVMADVLAQHAAFLSIGTNDLVQYALAVDRTSRELAYLASYFDPAILRLIRGVLAAGVMHNRPVSVCGAMASDPLGAALLIGMGLRSLSMEASALGDVKEGVGRVTLAECEAVAREALKCSSSAEVERVLNDALSSKLGDLLEEEIQSSSDGSS